MNIIGHRGAAAHAPENTLASFALALSQGADAVECDIHAVGGRLIVLHDHTLERTTNGTGPLGDWEFDALRTLDAGGGQPIPTLDEVLDLCSGKATVHIELKGAQTAEPTARLLAERKTAGIVDDVVVSSFDHAQLTDLLRADPAIRTAALNGEPLPADAAGAQALGTFAIHPNRKGLTEAFVVDAHRRGLVVNVWTVNDPEVARRLHGWGVDGLITDDPAGIIAALRD
jgi:glycerophosphoryl diester phosphodiesterase